MTPSEPKNVQAVAALAASKCSRCPREILLLEKAFMNEDYSMFCVHCMADAYNTLRQRTAMRGFVWPDDEGKRP